MVRWVFLVNFLVLKVLSIAMLLLFLYNIGYFTIKNLKFDMQSLLQY